MRCERRGVGGVRVLVVSGSCVGEDVRFLGESTSDPRRWYPTPLRFGAGVPAIPLKGQASAGTSLTPFRGPYPMRGTSTPYGAQVGRVLRDPLRGRCWQSLGAGILPRLNGKDNQ